MKRTYYFLLISFLSLPDILSSAQKPVKEIPQNILIQIVQVFMASVYDTAVKQQDRILPLLEENKKHYDFYYDKPDQGLLGDINFPKAILLGDIDGDGTDEMIITPIANFGGSACFGYIFLFKSVKGKWQLLTYLDQIDRFLEDQHIIDGVLYGTILEYDPTDAHCCPSLLTKIWYRYNSSKYELVEGGRNFIKKTEK